MRFQCPSAYDSSETFEFECERCLEDQIGFFNCFNINHNSSTEVDGRAVLISK